MLIPSTVCRNSAEPRPFFFNFKEFMKGDINEQKTFYLGSPSLEWL